jgi:Protein of unknown function (DUF4232)
MNSPQLRLPPQAPPTTTTTTTPVAQASIRCEPSQLVLAIGPFVSEPTQQHTVMLMLTNESNTACFLFGYPGIALYDYKGQFLPNDYRRQGDQVVTPSAPRRVVLGSGASAFAVINKNACVAYTQSYASTLRLIPPDDTTSMSIAVSRFGPGLDVCGPGDPGYGLDISPVEPTASATLAHG